jgi:hypothetical protein
MHFGADAGQAPSFRAVPPTASYRVVRGIIATQQTGAGYRIVTSCCPIKGFPIASTNALIAYFVESLRVLTRIFENPSRDIT